MKENENLYDKIKEMFGQDPGSFNIMEDNIDVDLQLEYFEFSNKVSSEYDSNWALDQVDMLSDQDIPIEDKKLILARLATTDDVRAFRAIEAYMDNPDEQLRDWGTLALQESKMHIEGHLLEENQIFISTGLGGKNGKLRYFVVLIARGRRNLSEFQLDIIQKEFPYILKAFNAEVEEFNSEGYLATIQLIIPIQHSVKKIFTRAIRECNQYGDFLRESCIVTNVKKLSFDEVTGFIEQKKDNTQSS